MFGRILRYLFSGYIVKSFLIAFLGLCLFPELPVHAQRDTTQVRDTLQAAVKTDSRSIFAAPGVKRLEPVVFTTMVSATGTGDVVKFIQTLPGVSTGIGDHESKYAGTHDAEDATEGDEQFEINDARSLKQMYDDMVREGLQPVMNDYLYL